MNAYLEILGAVMTLRHDLTDSDLRNIGEFTQDNVLQFIETRYGNSLIGLLPVEGFRVYGLRKGE